MSMRGDSTHLNPGARPTVEDLRARIAPELLMEAFSRSGGPGGQNVNKVSTRVQLVFNLAECAALSGEEKERIGLRLRRRVNKAGELRITMSRFRSQAANREAAEELFYELLVAALHRPRARKATRVPAGAKRRRVNDKRHRGERKQSRGAVDRED